MEFSIGLHRYVIYPEGHPSLTPAAATVLDRLTHLLEGREDLRLGVLRFSFVLEGAESSPSQRTLAELAGRLHDHEVAAMTFGPGIQSRELRELFEALSVEVSRDGVALGRMIRTSPPDWPHVSIEALDYSGLGLDDGGDAEARAVDLWLALVRTSLGGRGEAQGPDVGRAMAESVEQGSRDPLQAPLVAGYLAPLLDALADVPDGRLDDVREGLSSFVRSLDPSARTRLLAAGGDAAWQRELLVSASGALHAEPLLDLLDGAVEASGQTISNSMTRLFTKLAANRDVDDPAGRRRADAALRDQVRSLMRDWSLEDPNPQAYTVLLESLARRGGVPALDPQDQVDVAERLVTISLETAQWTARSRIALDALLEAGMLMRVFELVDAVPAGAGHAAFMKDVVRPEAVRRIVHHDRPDADGLRRIAEAAGPDIIPPLLDGLLQAEDRDTRRLLFDVLSTFGVALIPEVSRRLPSTQWYQTRNLLNLLAQVPGTAEFDPMEYLLHVDPRVRRAALPVAAETPGYSDAALAVALRDRDERVVLDAIYRFRERSTPPVLDAILTRVVLADRSPELRILAIRAAREHQSPVVRDCLLEVVVRALRGEGADNPLSGRVAAAALDALRAGWPGADDVLELQQEAQESRFASLRRAVDTV
ncbi:MAG: hypothetical protein KJP18_09005 [Gemmatimonadetes bacterium]|nr:hypothetical protein [Gemmatimonadota bacterium]